MGSYLCYFDMSELDTGSKLNRILIVGEHSYVGDSFAAYLRKFSEEYSVRKLSVRQPCWKEESFRDIDAIYYVAAIVHCKESLVPEEEFYRVNCQLPFAVASKAKREGVKQFIFVSSMSVYGMLTGCIDGNTVPGPNTLYGRTKLQAENEINKLSSDEFFVAILRPPMIYGENCKGNFEKLRKLAFKCPFFPSIENRRSMLYVENLNSLVEQIIRYRKRGLFSPQDAELVCTLELVRLFRERKGKKLYDIKWFNPLIHVLWKRLPVLQKMLGSLYYVPDISRVEGIEYQKYKLSEAISEMIK